MLQATYAATSDNVIMAANPSFVDNHKASQRETAWNRQGIIVLKRTESAPICPGTEVELEMAGSYAFGPFRLDISGEILFRGAEPLPVGRRAVALLRKLLEQPGAPVSKDALIEAAWPGLAVEESNLTVQIAALRRVLGATPGGDRWIETLPRRGYRFIGPVGTEGQTSAMEAPAQVDAAPELAPSPLKDTERRQITTVSCELTGKTDGMDLEDWREAVGAFRRCVSETIARHNGFIASYLGNSVLVLFGYPAAHEHDAERAVRAGLELCAAVRTLRSVTDAPMRCRVGVATGMAIIGDIAEGAARAPEIVGDTPDLAVRLQASAQPDTVAIDRATRQLVGNLFDCRDLDAIETDGSSEPMRRWQVLAERIVESRFEALRGSALSPLIGRDEEVDLLLRRWARAKAGDGQVVLISGEPGIGKSRLVTALAERLGAEPYVRLSYFCSPHRRESTLSPFVDQLGRAAGFAHGDQPVNKLEKLEALLARAAPPDADLALLVDLLSLPASERHPLPQLSPQQKKERTLEALIRQLESLARHQTVLAVLDDAHWIDPTSRELLDLTVDRVRTLPVLLIVTFRRDFQGPWTGLPRVTMLALTRLGRSERMTLVKRITGGKPLPEEVVAQIVDRTDGVPLFVEELTKSVLESGLLREERDSYVLERALPPLAIPTTLHASLVARLDNLGSVRRVAQIGAAIGREFSYALVRTVSRLPEDELTAALGRLVASELVFRRGTPPDAVYSFKHALVQEAAYGSLLRSTRQQLHAQIAQAIETHFTELIEDQPELLAQHYAEAGLAEKSAAFWSKAGRRSIARTGMTEAAAQLQKGLDQLALLPDNPARRRQELELRSELGGVLMVVKGYAAQETGDAFARARELWEQLGSPSEFLHVAWGQSRYLGFRGQLDSAQRLADDLLRLSRQRGDSAGLVLGHLSSGRNLMFAGRLTQSRLHLKEVLALYEPELHRSLVHQAGGDPHVNSQALLSIVLFCLGCPYQALARSNAAISEARRLPHLPSLAVSFACNAVLLSLLGDSASLEERADELVAVAADQGSPLWRAQGTIYGGWAKAKKGNVTDGMALLGRGAGAFRATGAERWAPYHTALMAGAFELEEQIDEAANLLDEALAIVEITGERWFAAELNRHKGRLLLQQGNSEGADQLYRKALGIAKEQGAKLWELRAAISIARLWGEQSRRAEARDLLAPVYGWFTEGFDTADLREAKELLDALSG
jgi:class 3 adenylate cyclase/predicted ATPase